jgi:antibiotic biosynthesis monooxygenase (ABM) superfamily enzyme
MNRRTTSPNRRRMHHYLHRKTKLCGSFVGTKSGREKDYDGWLERYSTSERKAPGYIGTTIIIPGGSKSSLRYIIHRFIDRVKKETWENSQK